MKLRDDPQVSISGHDLCNAVFIKFPKFFFKSVIAWSFVMTMVRGAAKTVGDTKVSIKTLDDFLSDITNVVQRHADSSQLRSGIAEGNVKSILDKTLPCVTKPGREDWLVKRQGSFQHPGFVTYRKEFHEPDARWTEALMTNYYGLNN